MFAISRGKLFFFFLIFFYWSIFRKSFIFTVFVVKLREAFIKKKKKIVTNVTIGGGPADKK